MTLTKAIGILTRIHTQSRPYGIDADNPRMFEIVIGATPSSCMTWGVSENDWIEAWGVMRENAGMMPERETP